MSLCAYPPCSKEFEPKTKRAKYCSGSCRAKNSVLRRVEEGSLSATPKPITPKPEVTMDRHEIPKPAGLDIHAQYVITAQEKEISRWEKAYQEERTRRKEVEKEKAKVAEELATLKTDQLIAQKSKPSGLDGIMENPMIQAIMPHAGAAIGEWVKLKLIGKNPQIGGLEADPAALWISEQSEEVQNALRALVNELAKLDSPEKVLHALGLFKNQLAAPAAGGPQVHQPGQPRRGGRVVGI